MCFGLLSVFFREHRYKVTLSNESLQYFLKFLKVSINNNYDNLYGTVTRPYRYKDALQATIMYYVRIWLYHFVMSIILPAGTSFLFA